MASNDIESIWSEGLEIEPSKPADFQKLISCNVDDIRDDGMVFSTRSISGDDDMFQHRAAMNNFIGMAFRNRSISGDDDMFQLRAAMDNNKRTNPRIMNNRHTLNTKKPIYRTRLTARDLSIFWIESRNHWKWTQIQAKRGGPLDVVEALQIPWLRITGNFEAGKLAQGPMYEALFVVMLNDNAWGWDNPVNLTLILPDGTKQERTESLLDKPKNRWITIQVGKFNVWETMVGDIKISLTLYDNVRKRGLVVIGALLAQK